MSSSKVELYNFLPRVIFLDTFLSLESTPESGHNKVWRRNNSTSRRTFAPCRTMAGGESGCSRCLRIMGACESCGYIAPLSTGKKRWHLSKRQTKLSVAVVSLLAALLPLLSSHYTHHTLGYPIVKNLLSPRWMRKLNSYVGGTQNELILVTLKLLNAISGYAGGREKKTLLEGFQWETKARCVLGYHQFHLLTFTRIYPNYWSSGERDLIIALCCNLVHRSAFININQDFGTDCVSADIRTLYILFLLSFLDSQTQVKTAFLEQHRDAFLGIFKGLPQDHYLLIRHVLEAIWTNLLSDLKVKRTTKVGFFNELTISHVCSSNKTS